MVYNQSTCLPGSTPYTIKAGDTFFNLANRFNTTVDAIMKANPGVDPNRLFIGQVICIPSPTPTPPPTHPCSTLRLGSRGAYVVDLQQRLLSFGFNPGPIDGIFGNQTQAAVISFQKSRNLVPDGIVGVKTWTALGVNCGTVPPPTTCPSGTFSYTVKTGDTFYNLAIKYNITVDSIIKANPGVDPNRLQIGQTICIPR